MNLTHEGGSVQFKDALAWASRSMHTAGSMISKEEGATNLSIRQAFSEVNRESGVYPKIEKTRWKVFQI